MQKSDIRVLIVILIVLCIGALATYYVVTRPPEKGPSEASRTLQTSEEQVFTDLQGNPFSLEQFEGKIRIVNVWASWSPLSAQELGDMQRFASDYAGDDVVFIAINRKEHTAMAQQYLDAYGIGGEIVFVIDENDTFYRSVGGYAMPETVVYSKEGDIVLHTRGVLSYEDYAQIVQNAQ